MPSPQDRLRRRERKVDGFSRGFELLTDRRLVACFWLVGALICVLAGLGVEGPGAQSGMAQALALAGVLGVAGLSGMYWRRWRGESTPERLSKDAPAERPSWQRWAGRIGVVAMVAGMAVMAGNWLTSHRHVPASELVLPVHDTKESVEVVQGDRHVDVMLPLRTTLQDVQFGDEPRAEVQFARPGQDGVSGREFGPGDSLDIEGMRFAFSGFHTGETRLRAVLSSPEENTISVAGAIGDRVQISVDGPTYRIVDARRDFLDLLMPATGLDEETVQLLLMEQGFPMGVMGPAVQLETEGGHTFWLFTRGGPMEILATGESLQLKEVQEVPSVVMSITTVRSFWPFALGLIVFVIGWMLSFGFAERLVRRRDDDSWELWSINRIEESFGDSGGDDISNWYRTIVSLVAVVGLGLAVAFELSQVGWLGLAGFVGLLGLPMAVDRSSRRRALVVASTIPVAAIIVAVAGGHPWIVGAQAGSEAAIWTAKLGSWIAMATALLGAGVVAERRLGGRSGGAVTVALGIWAAMAAVVTLGVRRGGGVQEGMALPLAAESGEAVWAIPDVATASELQIPITVSATEVGWLALVVAVLATVGLSGRAIGSIKTALFGWIGALLATVVGAMNLIGVGASSGAMVSPDGAAYVEAARNWLRARDLPTWIADQGEFQYEGALDIHRAALAPEILAFAVAALLAAAMIGLTLWSHHRRTQNLEVPSDDPVDSYAGRDQFVRAIMFGWMGWTLGLIGAWEHLGAAGVQGSMEWLGLGLLCAAMGVLLIGWRRDASLAESFAAIVGPAVVLGLLGWVMFFGVSLGLLPGSSVGF